MKTSKIKIHEKTARGPYKPRLPARLPCDCQKVHDLYEKVDDLLTARRKIDDTLIFLRNKIQRIRNKETL